MALKAMNNQERAAAKLLKEKGFEVFYQYQGANRGDYWAKHPKLPFQYHIATKSNQALQDLKNLNL